MTLLFSKSIPTQTGCWEDAGGKSVSLQASFGCNLWRKRKFACVKANGKVGAAFWEKSVNNVPIDSMCI